MKRTVLLVAQRRPARYLLRRVHRRDVAPAAFLGARASLIAGGSVEDPQTTMHTSLDGHFECGLGVEMKDGGRHHRFSSLEVTKAIRVFISCSFCTIHNAAQASREPLCYLTINAHFNLPLSASGP